MPRSHRRAGMSPSQTLLGLVLVAVIALMLAYRFAGTPTQQDRKLTIRRIETVMAGLESYATDSGGMFPTTEQGLKALLARPSHRPVPHNWQGPYVAQADLTDAWGMPLNYVSPAGDGRVYHLWSNGADKTEGGERAEADIQSWQRPSMCP